MRVTVLGCGGSAGVPQVGGADGRGDWGQCDPGEPRNRRTRSSVVLELPEGRLLIDTGPDLRHQLLACAIPTVEAVLFTHAHADHITGLDEVRILNRLIGRPMDSYATAPVIEEIRERFGYALKPWTPPGFFRPVLNPIPVDAGTEVRILGASVRLLDQDHGFLRTLGLRVGNFAYCTDIAVLDDVLLDRLQGVDTWMVDCFQRRAHRTHANVEQVIEWATRVGARRTILTHMGYDLDWNWLVQRLPDGIEPAWDGLVIET